MRVEERTPPTVRPSASLPSGRCPRRRGRFARPIREQFPLPSGTAAAHTDGMAGKFDSTPRFHGLALAAGGVAVVEVAATAVLTVAVGWSWREALEVFTATNAAMGVSFAVCGSVIAWHRPRNPVGWLFAAGGLAHATSALMAPLLQALHDVGAPLGAQRLAVTVFQWSWPWSIALFLPLSLLLFPDGRPPSRRWRPVVAAVVVTAPLFIVYFGTDPAPLLGVNGYLTLSGHGQLSALWAVAELRTSAALMLAVAGLVVRYRRAGDVQRRQLLWLLLAAITVLAVALPWAFVAGTPIVVLFAIPLIPVSVAIAIVRHGLLDIRLVVSRAVAWVLLSLCAVMAYVILVAVLDRFVSAQLGRSAVATVIVALCMAPVLPRLQRGIERAMYGDRHNPARVASHVAEQLRAAPSHGLAGVAVAMRQALRLPYAEVRGPDGVLGADGTPPPQTHTLALEYAGRRVGELVVGLRPGERALAAADADVLGLITVPLAVALHAVGLSAQLRSSRGRIIAAREEERRRLRRDLHDGLGPTLTGLAFAADAAANVVDDDVAAARDLLASLRSDSRAAIAEIRRLVDDLRPPALDELGLVGALRQRAEQTVRRADGTAVHVHLDVPAEEVQLPAAVEVAAYRIATEALTNAVRHSQATHIVVTVRCHDTLDINIVDDGAPHNGAWIPGVGLRAMRERADELGGRLHAGPSPAGGRVCVSLPLVVP